MPEPEHQGFERLVGSRPAAGKEIAEFLVTRYGEFALYRPRSTGKMLLLWLAPFLLVVVGGIAMVRVVKHRMTLPIEPEEGRTE